MLEIIVFCEFLFELIVKICESPMIDDTSSQALERVPNKSSRYRKSLDLRTSLVDRGTYNKTACSSIKSKRFQGFSFHPLSDTYFERSSRCLPETYIWRSSHPHCCHGKGVYYPYHVER